MNAPMESTEPAVVEKPGIVRRVVRYPLVQALIGAVMILTALTIVSALGGLLHIASGPGFPFLAVLLALAVVLGWKGYKRWIEREPDREFAFKGAAVELVAGLAAGEGLHAEASAGADAGVVHGGSHVEFPLRGEIGSPLKRAAGAIETAEVR